MIDCLRSLFGEVRASAHQVALGLVSTTLYYATVKQVVSVDLLAMIRTDCSGEAGLALHVSSSS